MIITWKFVAKVSKNVIMGLIIGGLTPVYGEVSFEDNFFSQSSANPKFSPIQEEPYYVPMRRLLDAHKYQEVITKAHEYLNKYPDDMDVRLVLGQAYLALNLPKKAQREVAQVVAKTPTDVDAVLVLANTKASMLDYKAALSTINQGLLLKPNDPLLLKKKTLFTKASSIHKNHAHITKKILLPQKVPPKPLEKQQYRNEAGLYQQMYYISDRNKVWDYTTVYYGRKTSIGKIYGKINYANRLKHEAVQAEIEAYPKLNRYIYLDLDASIANEPNLFPDYAFGGEAYISAPNLVDFSLGGRFNKVDLNHVFSVYTGTVSKEIHNNRLTFRPLYFVPGVGKTSLLYILDYRHMLQDPYYYYGVIFGTGNSPDLANLTTVNFIVLQNTIVSPYINIPLYNDRLIVGFSFLYQHQIFPDRTHIRDWTGGTVGLAWNY